VLRAFRFMNAFRGHWRDDEDFPSVIQHEFEAAHVAAINLTYCRHLLFLPNLRFAGRALPSHAQSLSSVGTVTSLPRTRYSEPQHF
jgi:hypothetical protein